MVNQANFKDLQGQLYRVKGNEPILLDDPQKVWLVQSGSMALFAVTVKDSVIEGTRRYLFSISQGEAFFGIFVNDFNEHRQILAVPIGEAEVLQVNEECFRELVADGDARAIAWVEGWLGQIGTVLSHIATPAIQVRAEGGAQFSLSNGQTFQPESGVICWVQIQQGTVRWMGFEELTLTSAVGTFPLSDRMWLEAVEGVQLVTETTTDFRNLDIVFGGLSQLHTQLMRCIDLLDQREAEEELQRLRDRQSLNRQVTAEALEELASTLNSQDGDVSLEGTPLLAAAGAVGRAMGVEIRPPARSEDLKRVKEPLEAILRASRIRMRQVLLRDNWWEKDGGPLVAYTQQDN